jgi:UDP-N-acetyl-D-glucosamine dehydrogenase
MQVTAVETSAERRANIETPADYDHVLAALSEYREREAFEVARYPTQGRYVATLLCVPTRGDDGTFDPSALLAALTQIGPHISNGELISIESTVPPFSCDRLLRPALERASGRRVGQDMFLVHVPEWYNLSVSLEFHKIPRVVGGITSNCTKAGVAFYSEIIDEVHPVSSALVAECAKMFEQAFRYVNVAFVNEFSIAARQWGIDPREAVAAAAGKPFGFMPFWPSTGVGGHCVPASARFLAEAIGRSGITADILTAAFAADERLPIDIAQTLQLAAGRRVLVLGAGYKSGSARTVESGGLRLARHLLSLGVEVEICDRRLPAGALGDDVRVRRPDEVRGRYDVAIVAAWEPAFEAVLARLESTRIVDLGGCAPTTPLDAMPAKAPS